MRGTGESVSYRACNMQKPYACTPIWKENETNGKGLDEFESDFRSATALLLASKSMTSTAGPESGTRAFQTTWSTRCQKATTPLMKGPHKSVAVN